jgi:hypothetical protein
MIRQTFLLIALSTTSFATIDQYFATNSSAYLRQMSTMNLSRRLVIVSVCFSLGR